MANLNIKKPLDKLMEEAKEDEKGLKRTLGAGNLHSPRQATAARSVSAESGAALALAGARQRNLA
ncbi:MAG TPA: hypothetical protein VLB84_05415, partial [Bacteroidia bacterium]|nr:hypothetical protein [Bacteroidia bacterium]